MLCCRYVLSNLEYDENVYRENSEKVTFPLFGNVLRHYFISHGSNKPHSDIARTHKGYFLVTCVLCSVHQVLLWFLFDECTITSSLCIHNLGEFVISIEF
jgi:hypothetical protein